MTPTEPETLFKIKVASGRTLTSQGQQKRITEPAALQGRFAREIGTKEPGSETGFEHADSQSFAVAAAGAAEDRLLRRTRRRRRCHVHRRLARRRGADLLDRAERVLVTPAVLVALLLRRRGRRDGRDHLDLPRRVPVARQFVPLD